MWKVKNEKKKEKKWKRGESAAAFKRGTSERGMENAALLDRRVS